VTTGFAYPTLVHGGGELIACFDGAIELIRFQVVGENIIEL
jgi:hypothetical protein